MAANKPDDRTDDEGIDKTVIIIRFIASGKSAYRSPSITSTSANAITRSGNIIIGGLLIIY
tara:strand:+ start:292 stop:474 length:183 start_codon:yes stop_codon:yes gene_type:complete